MTLTRAADDRPAAAPTARARRLVLLVEWYQRAYEGRPSPCRFTPSCSAYAHEALSVHGAWRGIYLTVRRLARCRPFGPSGFDPVPEAAAPASVPRTDP
jgi:putative membrane protein insertion efficiency factor